MADRQAPGGQSDGGSWTPAAALARLRQRRLPLAAAAVALLLLALLAQVSWPAAALLMVLAALLAALPLAGAAADAPAGGGPGPGPARAAGVIDFAAALPDPCFVLDRRGVVLFANQAAAIAFSIQAGEELTLRLRAPDLVAAFHRVAAGGEAEQVDFAERVPTERLFAARFAGLHPPAPGEPPEHVVLILDDLSERRRAERVRVDFVANASHELRTPLASLAGFIETLQGPARDDAKARERFLAVMRDQATRMSRLIDDLLSLSRIEMKAHVRPSGRVDLVRLIGRVAEGLAPLARDLGVVVETALPAASVTVRGDEDELVQVFQNLIENACKYGQAGERVLVTLARADAGAVVTVRDYGPGIAAEHLPRLTERFYRVDADRSRRHRGTGLGLAIVKHIVTRHQARLGIESVAGEGASFSVAFPRAEWVPIPEQAEKDERLQMVAPS